MSKEAVKRRFRIPAFWKGVIVVVIAYLIFDGCGSFETTHRDQKYES